MDFVFGFGLVAFEVEDVVGAGEQTAEGEAEQIGQGVLRAAWVAGIGNQPPRMMQQGRWQEGEGVWKLGEIVPRMDTPAPPFSSKSPVFVNPWKKSSWKTWRNW